MNERFKHLVEDYGEVQLGFDSRGEAGLHNHTTDFDEEPLVKLVVAREAH